MVIFDHINKTIAVVAHAQVDPANPEAAYADACRRIDELVRQLSENPATPPLVDIMAGGKVERNGP